MFDDAWQVCLQRQWNVAGLIFSNGEAPWLYLTVLLARGQVAANVKSAAQDFRCCFIEFTLLGGLRMHCRTRMIVSTVSEGIHHVDRFTVLPLTNCVCSSMAGYAPSRHGDLNNSAECNRHKPRFCVHDPMSSQANKRQQNHPADVWRGRVRYLLRRPNLCGGVVVRIHRSTGRSAHYDILLRYGYCAPVRLAMAPRWSISEPFSW